MFYHKLGEIPCKRHVVYRKEDGSLFREHLFGQEGFSSSSSLCYKKDLPTKTLKIERLAIPQPLDLEDQNLDFWHLRTAKLSLDPSFISARAPLFYNSSCQIAVSSCSRNDLFCNASHHEMYYFDEGKGRLLSEFGVVDFSSGDYVVIPKGLIYSLEFDIPGKWLQVQSLSPFRFPSRYLSSLGQFLEHSPVCERDIRPPSRLEPVFQKGEIPVLVHRNGFWFERLMSHHPFDTIGWDGCLYPYAISIHDFEPIVGRLHMPPPVHQIFETRDFVVCNFVPRLFDFHPQAIPAPYYHSNLDSDEVLYYCDGDFMSRSGIERGSITLHPAGIPHGPQPGKTEASIGKKETNELAVMIDTFAPLCVSTKARQIADSCYHESWLESTDRS